MKYFRHKRLEAIIIACVLILLPLASESYQVKKGDTLYSIANGYNVSVNDLMTLNHIKNPSSLGVGMVLTIPGTVSSAENVMYSVEKGDTYYSISQAHGLTVEALLSMNNLSVNDILSIGQSLKVGEKTATATVTIQRTTSDQTEKEVVQQVEREREAVNGEPQLVISRNGNRASTPQWPVSGNLFSVEGDFTGVLIESDPSTYVQAITEGEVVWAGPYWMFDNVVLIDSNDFIYFYGGNSDIFVNVGQQIEVGTRLGRLENNGGKGNLYFSVFKEGKVVDLAKAGN
jgi:LysM repeat protein